MGVGLFFRGVSACRQYEVVWGRMKGKEENIDGRKRER